MRMNLKLAIVAARGTHQTLAIEASKHLPPEMRVTELDVSKFVTSRKDPAPEQAAALARVLGRSPMELFNSEDFGCPPGASVRFCADEVGGVACRTPHPDPARRTPFPPVKGGVAP